MTSFINSSRFGAAEDEGGFPTSPPVSDMVAWYRSSDGVTVNGSGKVTDWSDISGNGYHLVSANTTALTVEPDRLNGYQSVEYGGGDYMKRLTTPSISDPCTVIVLAGSSLVATGFAEEHVLVDSNNSATKNTVVYMRHNSGQGEPTFRMYAGTRLDDNPRTNLLGKWWIYGAYFANNGTDSEGTLNGVNEMGPGNAGTAGGLLGINVGCDSSGSAGQTWKGPIMEVMVWSRALTDEEYERAITYLFQRYFTGFLEPPVDPADPDLPTEADCQAQSSECHLRYYSWLDVGGQYYCQCGDLPDVGAL